MRIRQLAIIAVYLLSVVTPAGLDWSTQLVIAGALAAVFSATLCVYGRSGPVTPIIVVTLVTIVLPYLFLVAIGLPVYGDIASSAHVVVTSTRTYTAFGGVEWLIPLSSSLIAVLAASRYLYHSKNRATRQTSSHCKTVFSSKEAMRGVGALYFVLTILLVLSTLLVWTPLYHLAPITVQQLVYGLGGLIAPLAPLLLVAVLATWHAMYSRRMRALQ